MEDVTPREIMEDAARIGAWIRELRFLEYEETVMHDRFMEEELQKDGDDSKRVHALITITVNKRIRAERPELVERVLFLRREIEAALTRGRLVEMAALAERWV